MIVNECLVKKHVEPFILIFRNILNIKYCLSKIKLFDTFADLLNRTRNESIS